MGNLKYEKEFTYYGTVEYDEKNDKLKGHVLGMRNELLLYEGNCIQELKENFRLCIDRYIDFCNKNGNKPKKPFNGSLNVRLGEDLHSRVASIAEQKKITINSFIKFAIIRELDEYNKNYPEIFLKK